MSIYYSIIDTKFGEILLLSNKEAIIGIYFMGEKYIPTIDKSFEKSQDLKLFKLASKQINEYIYEGRKEFELPLLYIKSSSFQLKVWEAISNILYGNTLSYKELANRIGMPNSIRAVAAAVGRNPISLIVPCHRVIGSSGSLTGYAGGIELKRSLLKLEGVIA